MGQYWKQNLNASYNIWSQITPAVGKEHLHCDRKRGYSRARKKEPEIGSLAKLDNIAQTIGIIAQRGVYEFHQNVQLLSEYNGVEKVADIIQLSQKPPEVKGRIEAILKNYYNQPILLDKNVLEISRGDEGIPKPILIKYGTLKFNLYAPFDCVFVEPDDTIHILDFKTGKSDFDLRQAYVYLVAANHLYPNRKAIASFYNLETQIASEPISATAEALDSVRIELYFAAQKLQQEIQAYKQNPELFDRIFPANPSVACQYCNFNFACEYAAE